MLLLATRSGATCIYYIPKTLKEVIVTGDFIPNAAFIYCDCLETIVFTGDISFIPTNAFFDCKSLVSLIIPNTDAYYKILNKNRNNISDAIIAACAVKNDCILMTNDRSLHNKMLKNRYSVISFQEFIKIIEQP